MRSASFLSIFRSNVRHKSRLYHVNLFFTLLWRKIENSGRAGGGRDDRLQKVTTKSKRNKNLKMLSFCAAFNCLNRAEKEKDKTNYRFPSIVKSNGKEGLKLLKVRMEEKWLAQIFRKYWTGTKLERTRTRIKIMLSSSLSSVFLQKFRNIRFERQIRILSSITVLELGPSVMQSFTWIQKFYDPTEDKFHKAKSENWLSISFELEFSWLGTYSHNHYTMFNLQCDGES